MKTLTQLKIVPLLLLLLVTTALGCKPDDDPEEPAVEYEITLQQNNGQANKIVAVAENKELDLSPHTPSTAGKFEGWFEKANFSGKAVTKIKVTKNISLYAKNVFTVTFSVDGADNPKAATTTYGKTVTAPPEPKAKTKPEDRWFAGWYEEKQSELVFNNKWNFATAITANKTLHGRLGYNFGVKIKIDLTFLPPDNNVIENLPPEKKINGVKYGLVHHSGHFYGVTPSANNRILSMKVDGTYDASKEIKLHVANTLPYGIEYHDNHFYVADFGSKVYAYLATDANGKKRGAYIDDKSFVIKAGATGITYYDKKFHILSYTDKRIYLYDDKGNDTGTVYDLHADHTRPYGLQYYNGSLYSGNASFYVFNYDLGSYSLKRKISSSITNGLTVVNDILYKTNAFGGQVLLYSLGRP